MDINVNMNSIDKTVYKVNKKYMWGMYYILIIGVKITHTGGEIITKRLNKQLNLK